MDVFKKPSLKFFSFLHFLWTMLPKKGTFTMDWYLPSPKWMFVINALLLLLHVSVAKTLEPILWDKHIFQSNGPDGYRIEASINDVIDIVCPRINDTFQPDRAQYHKFTQVTKSGYDNCNLAMGGGKTLLRCNRPFVENQLRLLFQEHTTYPGDPIFKHGRDYYFITTADGTEDGIDQSQGGLCSSHYMKLLVHVIGDGITGIPSSSRPTTRDRYNSPTTLLPVSRSISTTSPKASTKLETTVKPTRRKPNKKPNESSGNDPYTGDGDSKSSNHRLSWTILLLCTTIAFVRWF
ncbi:ephrin-B2-like isoform X2 [Apostichopus japonicus]|uniref:ephrin-B2-like isoform X2 n=1 Tax=Stichopus japonicus TaxID=307972 RepID=UPI003AB2B3A5